MSEIKNPFVMTDFFTIEVECIEMGDELPFDCFIYLEKNQKVLHWLRQGEIFGPDKKEKMSQLSGFQLLLKNDQKPIYLKYLKEKEQNPQSFVSPLPKSMEFEPPKLFGKGRLKFDLPQSEVKSSSQNSKIKVDAEFLNIVITSTILVFKDVCGVAVELKSSKKRQINGPRLLEIDLASFIALSSQSIRGTVGLCFPEKTYLYLLSQATGLSFDSVTSDLAMGAGEFMYQIFETARPNLIELGYVIDRAAPSLVADSKMSVPHVMPDPGFSVLFDSPGGPFLFEIGIKTGA